MNATIKQTLGEKAAESITAEAFEPVIRRCADLIYAGLLEAVQDYLKSNCEWNIQAEIDAADRSATIARTERDTALEHAEWLAEALEAALDAITQLPDIVGQDYVSELADARSALAAYNAWRLA